MRKNGKKLLSLVLALVMAVGLLPTALAVTAATPHDSYAEVGGITRYTVLVLDTSSTSGFSDRNGNTFYTADTAVPYVKAAANRFVEDIQKADGMNYVAIVSYTGESSSIVSNFTTDNQTLSDAINSLFSSSDDTRSVAEGLKSANRLIDSVGNGSNIVKNVVLFTTGITNTGDYSYNGHYNKSTIASNWQNADSKIKLYAYSNSAYDMAEIVKTKANLYTVGLFQTMEDMPAQGRDVVEFFKLFTRDCASSPDYFYDVKNPNDLKFTFGEVADDITSPDWSFKDGVLTLKFKGDIPNYAPYDPAPWSKYSAQITEVVINNSVTSIGEYAFAGCSNLEFIKFPYGVQEIGDYAFAECPKIYTILLPSSLNRIGNSAFEDCVELEDVRFAGSKSQWEAINKGFYIFPYTFTENVWYGSYGEERPVPFISSSVPQDKRNTGLTWDVESLKRLSSKGIDLSLAVLGASMSSAIEMSPDEIHNLLVYVGCDEDEIESYNFDKDQVDRVGTSIGHMVITDSNGEEEDVIFVVCRGTTTEGDVWTDILSILFSTSFSGPASNVKDNLTRFCQEHNICDKLSNYKGKFVLFGHSLGAATVAALGKDLTDSLTKPFGANGANQVYCYTIGSPASLAVRPSRVPQKIDSQKYNNIHNYVHEHDDVTKWGGPYWIGETYKLDYNDPKYSRFDEIYRELTGTGYDYNDKSSTLGKHPGVAHDPTTYVSYLLCKVPNLTPEKQYPTIVRIACPVDVEIANQEGQVIGRVVDNVIQDYIPVNFSISVEDDVKTIIFANRDEYVINLVGTDEGTMDYSVTKYDVATNTALSEKKYENVVITEGKKFTTEVKSDINSSESTVQQTTLYILGPTGIPEKEVLPDGKGTEIPYEPAPAVPVKFTDVPAGSWYYDAVYWAVDKDIVSGTSPTTFTPNRTCTTTEIVTLLWHAAGRPASTAQLPFTLNARLGFAEGALRWAYEEGIIDAAFDQTAPCTRAGAAKFLWQAFGSPATAVANSFTDVPAGAGYAPAVAWAAGRGIIKGTSSTTFTPDTTCTRAEIVTLLYRAYK